MAVRFCKGPRGNPVMAAGPAVWPRCGDRLTALLAEGAAEAGSLKGILSRRPDAIMHMPFTVAEYTDFYARQASRLQCRHDVPGPENALPPNWLSIPIGYNGRASSVVVSGTDVRRPWGQGEGSE